MNARKLADEIWGTKDIKDVSEFNISLESAINMMEKYAEIKCGVNCMEIYTEEEVIKLLKEQRDICYQSAKIISHEYVNPYSGSDGETTTIIDKESIIDAKIPELPHPANGEKNY